MSPARIRAALHKEFRQFFRDPVLLFLVLWLYTAEVVICALSVTFDLNEEPVAVLDLDGSMASRRLADQLDRSSAFDVRLRPGNEREIRPLLDRGRARLAAVIPSRFEEELGRSGTAEVQLLVDARQRLARVAQGWMGVVDYLHARSLACWTDALRAPGSADSTRGSILQARKQPRSNTPCDLLS